MNIQRLFGLLCLLIACVAQAKQESSVRSPNESTPEILVTAFRGRQWQVRYDFDAPVTQLMFARSPDSSRIQTWVADQGFEIVPTQHGDVARRKDREPFRTVRFRMDATYRVLPKDYAPFSPFGDGGMLFHSGRFFACAELCAESAQWHLQLWASPQDNIVSSGKVELGNASWTDRGDGRVVYIGASRPQESENFVMVLDKALPGEIRDQLLRELPIFMRFFASKMGVLPQRPMLFVSYDSQHSPGWGRQGGVLLGQIFIHFYGENWPTQMTKLDFANDLAWHFAHEGAHLYQGDGTSTSNADSWINEGGAEAWAVIALRSLKSPPVGFLNSRIEKSREQCQQQLGDQSIAEAIQSKNFDVGYSCGLLINLAVDQVVRSKTNRDGLMAVWRTYTHSIEQGSASGDATFLAAIESVGGRELASWVQSVLKVKYPVIDYAATRLGR
jgi:hypothetical protein